MRVAIVAAFLLVPGFASAQVPSLCDELWAERNAKYKDAGYCFKTSRAIAAFGNAGCRYDNLADVPLSVRQRADISAIEIEERNRGCRR